jgi:hypothetical protein
LRLKQLQHWLTVNGFIDYEQHLSDKWFDRASITDVGGDDGVGLATHPRCDNVVVVGVRQRERRLEDLPALDGRILERAVRGCEPLGDHIW